jgi:hypothetical protein
MRYILFFFYCLQRNNNTRRSKSNALASDNRPEDGSFTLTKKF